MFDRRLRPVKARALRPLTARLARFKGAAAALTAGGLVFGLAAAALAALGWWLPALVAWGLNRLADGLDGDVARKSGGPSDRGGFADLVADMVVYTAVPLGVATGRGGRTDWIVAALLLASFAINIVTVTHLAAILEKRSAGAGSADRSTTVALPVGLVEGTETLVFLTVLLALPALAPLTMAIMAAAVLATAIGRFVGAWSMLGPPSSDTEPSGTDRRDDRPAAVGR